MAAIRHQFTIDAPAATVYAALTEQRGLAGWWTLETIAEPVVGSVAEFIFGDTYHDKMRVTRLESDLRVEWECFAGHEQWLGTTFVFDLEARGEQTIVRFTHGDWRDATEYLAICNYHWGFYLRSLKAYCETGKGEPYDKDEG